jgi:hypothetical protein
MDSVIGIAYYSLIFYFIRENNNDFTIAWFLISLEKTIMIFIVKNKNGEI